jgi:hypothetical protein
MKSLYKTLCKAFPFIGTRGITDDDALIFCSDHRIELVFTPFITDAAYVHSEGYDFIFVNEHMKGRRRLHRIVHEIGHYLLHGPRGEKYAVELFGVAHYRDSRRECEAETAAALLMLTAADLADPVYCGVFKYDIELKNLVTLREKYLLKYGKMKSIEGSIKKAPDNKRWVARVQYSDNEGRRRQKARYCVTFAAAKEKIKELRSDIENEKEGRVTYRQLDQFFRKEYLHAAKFVNGQKISGFRQPLGVVKNYLDGLLNHFGDRPIESITYADLQEFKKKIAALPTGRLSGVRSVSDVNLYLKRLRRLFNIAIEQGWLSVNPFNRGGSLINESFEVERTRDFIAS